MARYRSGLVLLVILVGFGALMVVAVGRREGNAPSDSSRLPGGRSPSAVAGLDPRPAGRLTGTVRRAPTGRPLADVDVELRQAGRSAARTLTTADGRYEMTSLAPGEYSLIARTHPRAKESRIDSVVVPTDRDGTQDLVLETGPIVSGRVVTADHRRLNLASFTVVDASRPREAEVGSRQLDDRGGFEIILGIPRGRCRIVAMSPGYPDSEAVEFDGSSDVEGILLNLIVGGGLRGVVEDEQKRPVAGAVVSLQPRLAESVPRTSRRESSDASGRFSFRDLVPGDYHPAVSAEGFATATTLESVQILAGQEQGPLTFRLSRGWSLWGKVVSQAGRPIDQAEIDVTEGERTYTTMSNPDGTFRLVGISPGQEDNAPGAVDSLTCRAKGYATILRSALAPNLEVTLVLEKGGAIAISTAFPEGPVPKDFSWTARVTLVRPLSGGDAPASSNAVHAMRGRSGLVEELAPGTYDLQIAALGRQGVSKTGILVTAGAAAQVDVTLTPGKSTGLGAPLRFKDAAGLRSQLKEKMTDLDPEAKKALLDFLRSARTSFPEDHPTRKAIDEVLQEYPE